MRRTKPILTLICAASMTCTAAAADENKAGDSNKQTHYYRVLYDKIASGDKPTLQARRFTGRLLLADVGKIFGDVKELPEDRYGNRVGGWKRFKDRLWSVVADPSLQAVNILTIGPDGTMHSTLDLNGDRVADIVDIRLADGRRLSFVIEQFGRELFETWLTGENNPLCADKLHEQLDIPLFGCGDVGSDTSGGGTAGAYGNAGIYDPLGELCDRYEGPGSHLNPPVMAHGGHGYGHRDSTNVEIARDIDGAREHAERTVVYRDTEGNHVSTTKEITYFDESGDRSRVVRETVDHDGHGERTITDYGADGTSKSREETFETEVDENGDYGPAPEDHEHAPEGSSYARNSSDGDNTPDADDVPDGDTTDPGPGGDPGTPGAGMAQWCAAQDDYVSGVEHAAGTEHTSFTVECDDFVKYNRSGGCTVLDWAASEEIVDAFGGISPSGGCGEFEQPGPDGTCGPASGIDRLLGNAILLQSVEFKDVELCDPMVCNPGF